MTRLVASVVLGVAAIVTTCALGQWQLRRAGAKEVMERQFEAAARAPAATPSARELADPATLEHRRLRLRGRWQPERVVYLDHRQQAGRVGVYVLMTLRIRDPVDTDVVVNRGWLPADPGDRRHIAPYATPSTEVVIEGLALPDEPRLLELGRDEGRRLGGVWQNFDFDAFGRLTGTAPVRLVVREEPGASAGEQSSDGLDRRWPEREGALRAQIDRHRGYAVQWFALAGTFAVLLAVQLFRSSKHVPRHAG